ncbi:uncharacterized protein HKW66_Vig0033070 [Vigna angularis]|uniref:Uncharacterized protein n=1 Tax=Phaseolus angularis TaxID=3914 RepID=A0A8T0LER6_PHAAN|nr:uncharacterized protein HKW66_Vig0033070 [Vigna angularis]
MAGLDLGSASRFVQNLHRPDLHLQQLHHDSEDQETPPHNRGGVPFDDDDRSQGLELASSGPGDIQAPPTTSSHGVGNNNGNNSNNNSFPDPSSGLPFFNLPLNMQNVQLPGEGWGGNAASRPPPF